MVTTEAPGYVLRDYQREAVTRVLAAHEQDSQRLLVALPTGTGKTVVGVHVAAVREGRCLFLVHRDELVEQTLDKFRSVLPQVAVGVVKAERDDVTAPIVVASVQTLARERRLLRLLAATRDLGPFRTVICDEAHHAVAPSWRTVLEGLGGLSIDLAATAEARQEALDAGRVPTGERIPSRESVPGGPLVLGLTATPERGDGLALDTVWQRIVYQRTILEMILAGHLCDLRALQVGRGVDLSGVRTTVTEMGRDFDAASLGAQLEAQGVPAELAAAYRSHAPGRRALVFVPTVAMAMRTRDAFAAAGVDAGFVCATTPPAERRALVDGLRAGSLPVLVNVGVLTEGFDAPAVDCIIVGRPTQSRPLYTQIVGRGTRRYPGKADCLVLELVGRNTRHKLVTVEDLTGRKLKTGQSVREAEAEAEAETLAQAIDRASTTAVVNLFASLRWLPQPDGRFSLAAGGRGTVWLLPEGTEHCHVERRSGGKGEPLFDGRLLRTDYAQGMVEDLARREGWFHLADPGAPWRPLEATDRQRALLRSLGSERAGAAGLTRGEASDLISQATAARDGATYK